MFKHFAVEKEQYKKALAALREEQLRSGLVVDKMDEAPDLKRVVERMLKLTTPSQYRREDTLIQMQVLLRKKADDILASIAPEACSVLSCIPIGILNHSRVNASARADGYIAINIGITSALHAICKILCYVLSCQNKLSESAASELIVTSLRGLHSGDSRKIPKIGIQSLSSDPAATASALLRYQEVFLLCHEYGHFLCDHIGDRGVLDNVQIAVEEVHADEKALALLDDYAKAQGISKEVIFTAVDIFLTFQWLAEYLEWEVRTDNPSRWSLTGPSWEEAGRDMLGYALSDFMNGSIYYPPTVARKSAFHHWLHDKGILPGLEFAGRVDEVLRRLVEFNIRGEYDRQLARQELDTFLSRNPPVL